MHSQKSRYPIYWKLPLLLYAATWLTTSGFRLDQDMIYRFFLSVMLSAMNFELAGKAWSEFGAILSHGLAYSVPLMLILTCHEFGHYIQTRRYGVYSSLPYFIPMPFGPFGTLGAVIAMDGRIPHSKALFDIGISGPLAGLVPTLFCLYYGIKWSHFGPANGGDMEFGEPLLFQYLTHWIYGPVPPGISLYVHPVAMAGWVGLFLTSLNLLPFSQLDGGHVFYALLGPKAARFSSAIFFTLVVLIVFFNLWQWILILLLLLYIGIAHPPTADDSVPLGWFRRTLGWTTLAFIFIGLTPTPISIKEPEPKQSKPAWYCQQSFEPFFHLEESCAQRRQVF